MEFSTKEDVIKNYAEKRKGISEEEVKDLLDCFIGYFNRQFMKTNNLTEFAFQLDNFGTLYELEFDPRHLIKQWDDNSRVKTEKQLAEYVLTRAVKPKKFGLKDDKKLRI
jgi:hypothetical protein